MTTIPKLSMSPHAHYVTRQSLFDNQTFGILTDRQIERYRLMGKYGPVAKTVASSASSKRRRLSSKRQQLLNELIG